jgi:hypothetical protein
MLERIGLLKQEVFSGYSTQPSMELGKRVTGAIIVQ